MTGRNKLILSVTQEEIGRDNQVHLNDTGTKLFDNFSTSTRSEKVSKYCTLTKCQSQPSPMIVVEE